MIGVVLGLFAYPFVPLRRDVGAFLLGGDQDFFFKVCLSVWSARHNV